MLVQNIFHHGNLKDYQTKVLSCQLRVIINLTQKLIIMVLKQDCNLEEVV